MPPNGAQAVSQTVCENRGARARKRIHRVPGDQSDNADIVSALLKPLNEERQTPFGSARCVASWVNEENPHYCRAQRTWSINAAAAPAILGYANSWAFERMAIPSVSRSGFIASSRTRAATLVGYVSSQWPAYGISMSSGRMLWAVPTADARIYRPDAR